MDTMDTIIGIGCLFILLLIIRAFGAWMLRIDEVIKVQEEILKELKISNSYKLENKEKLESEEVQVNL